MSANTRTLSLYPGLLFDLGAVLFIYFVPALSHMLGFPLYLIEPMRLAVVLALVHTRHQNAYLLALTLPLFSFAVSAHPHFLKMLLITAELVLNVWLFLTLSKKLKVNQGVSLAVSILLSKGFYYFIKFILISAVLIEGSLVSTPLWVQALTLSVFALYLGLMRKPQSSS